MTRFENARDAKEFLISRIVAEAQREKVELSEVERKMLYFSETGWTLPDIMQVNDEFDRDYDPAKYEKKITRLIRNETKRLRKDSPSEFKLWVGAARKLSKEDHYISVMLDAAHVPVGIFSDRRKGFILGLVFAGGILAIGPLMEGLGLEAPRHLNHESYTINEPLSNFVGYSVVGFMALYFVGLLYAHFDSQRRLYKLADRIIEPIFSGVFKLFGIREK